MDEWESLSKYIQLFGQMIGSCITEEGNRQQKIRTLSLELGLQVQTKMEEYE